MDNGNTIYKKKIHMSTIVFKLKFLRQLFLFRSIFGIFKIESIKIS